MYEQAEYGNGLESLGKKNFFFFLISAKSVTKDNEKIIKHKNKAKFLFNLIPMTISISHLFSYYSL